jgi:hypothetical protein
VALLFMLGPMAGVLVLVGIDAAYSAFRLWYDERRALARLRTPVDPSVGLTPQATSLAVLIYVYGIPRRDVPGDHRDAVRYRFGTAAPLLLERVDRLLREASRLRDLPGEPGDDSSGAIARQLGAEYGILTPDAAKALAAWAISPGTAAPPGRAAP